MEYRSLGSSGVKVSEVGLGTFYGWGREISKKMVASVVGTALDNDINFGEIRTPFPLLPTRRICQLFFSRGRQPVDETQKRTVDPGIELP